MMYKPSVIDASSGEAPEQAPRWDLMDTESCGSGIRFFGSFSDRLGIRGYIWEEEVRRWSFEGPTRQGARPRGGALHPRDLLVAFLTEGPSLLGLIREENHVPKRIFLFGLRLIFCFFETLK